MGYDATYLAHEKARLFQTSTLKLLAASKLFQRNCKISTTVKLFDVPLPQFDS